MLSERGTDRLNTQLVAMIVDIGDDYRIRRFELRRGEKNTDDVFRISFARRSSAFSFFNRAFSAAIAKPGA